MMFSSVPVSDHIKSALAAPYAALAQWSKALAPVLFALGTLLLVPAAPHWEIVSRWGQDLNVRQADRANKTRHFEVSERI